LAGASLLMPDSLELWRCAAEVIRQHGDDASAFCAARIAALEAAGAQQGADVWALILERVGDLMRPAPQPGERVQ
jgi:hypothetical protein